MKLTTADLKNLSVYLMERKVELYGQLVEAIEADNFKAGAEIEERIAFLNATQDKIYFELYGEVA